MPLQGVVDENLFIIKSSAGVYSAVTLRFSDLDAFLVPVGCVFGHFEVDEEVGQGPNVILYTMVTFPKPALPNDSKLKMQNE